MLSKLKKHVKTPFFKNLTVFFLSSMTAVGITVVLQFILPKIITIEEYGIYKKFTLYLSFTSLLHFGLKDGIYLKLSEDQNLGRKSTDIFYTTIITQQLIILLIMALLSVFSEGINQIFLLCLSATSFFLIMNTYYDSLYQSKKRFKTVSHLKVFKEVFFLVSVICVLLFFSKIDLEILLGLFVLSILLTFLIYTYLSKKLIGIHIPNKRDFIKTISPVYKRGIRLLTGNFGNQINANIDKLFISSFFSATTFAYYSFGGMFFVLVNSFVGSVATVLLPYLLTDYKKNLDIKYLQLLKFTTYFALALFIYIIGIFFIVLQFYPEYENSIPIIALFYIAMVYNVSINVVQNNYLKTLHLDKAYIKNNYLILGLFVAMMLLLYYLKIELQYYALCTSLFIYTRYKLNEREIVKKLEIQKKGNSYELLILILAIIAYMTSIYIV